MSFPLVAKVVEAREQTLILLMVIVQTTCGNLQWLYEQSQNYDIAATEIEEVK